MIKQYNITDYIKDDPELQKAVIKEFLKDIARLEEENKRLQAENEKKDNFLKWLITQQYYIIPKNLKQKIKEILKDV